MQGYPDILHSTHFLKHDIVIYKQSIFSKM